MDLYLKAGPSGSDLGDCPFAHYVRMVISIKGKGGECTVKPCVQGSSYHILDHIYIFKLTLKVALDVKNCHGHEPICHLIQDSKPEWLVKDLGGKMPCLDHSGKRTVGNTNQWTNISKSWRSNILSIHLWFPLDWECRYRRLPGRDLPRASAQIRGRREADRRVRGHRRHFPRLGQVEQGK